MMTKEETTKTVNFMTHGVFMLGRGHISHYTEYSIYSTLITIVVRDYTCAYNAAFLNH